jgi:hypothetical protein
MRSFLTDAQVRITSIVSAPRLPAHEELCPQRGLSGMLGCEGSDVEVCPFLASRRLRMNHGAPGNDPHA